MYDKEITNTKLTQKNFLKNSTIKLDTSGIAMPPSFFTGLRYIINLILSPMLILVIVLTGCQSNKYQSRIFLDPQVPACQTAYYNVKLNPDKPVFDSFWVDSLGNGRSWENALSPWIMPNHNYKVQIADQWVRYQNIDDPKTSTSFHFEPNRIRIRSESSGLNDAEPFTLLFRTSGYKPARATMLGHMLNERMMLPAIIHIPGQGTLRITAKASNEKDLSVVYGGTSMIFPAADKNCLWVEVDMEVITSYPKTAGIKNDTRFDGYRRNWLNILQINPKHQTLANNSNSDVCGFIYYQYGEIAMLTPQLAEGVSGPQVLRDSLDKFLAGKQSYGTPGYPNSGYLEPSLDTYPSLLTTAHQYYLGSKDKAWVIRNIDKLIQWAQYIVDGDKNGNGLIEYHRSGNLGECGAGPWGPRCRPANWWDCINFGYEDAYSNAIAYRALRGIARMTQIADRPQEAKRFEEAAKRLKASYYSTFYNPKTAMLAGWKSRDGQLHDYGFVFIQGMAITYGLVDDMEKARALMNATLKKMKEVGFNRFDLGLPGNLVNIPAEDYYEESPRWGGSNAFQKYENGGASANHVYFTLAALYKVGLKEQADEILFPILNSFNNGGFMGSREGSELTYDWLFWDGSPGGYEGLLVDNYLTVKAVLIRQGLVDPQWGSWGKSH